MAKAPATMLNPLAQPGLWLLPIPDTKSQYKYDKQSF